MTRQLWTPGRKGDPGQPGLPGDPGLTGPPGGVGILDWTNYNPGTLLNVALPLADAAVNTANLRLQFTPPTTMVRVEAEGFLNSNAVLNGAAFFTVRDASGALCSPYRVATWTNAASGHRARASMVVALATGSPVTLYLGAYATVAGITLGFGGGSGPAWLAAFAIDV